MKRILLLTDFSKHSMNAINYALELFSSNVFEFYVLHVQDSLAYTSDNLMTSRPGESLYSSLIKANKLKLNTLVNELKNTNKNHSFKALIDHDVFIDAIEQVIAKHQIDLVVMGTNGASDVREAVLGSNALKVLREIDCTTLVVPEYFHNSQIQSILLALDIGDCIDHITVENLIELVGQFQAKLEVVRLVSSDNPIETIETLDVSLLLKVLNEEQFNYHTISDVPLSYVVNTYVQTQAIDLLAFVGQYKNFFSRLFGEAGKTKISKQLKIPLVIFHN